MPPTSEDATLSTRDAGDRFDRPRRLPTPRRLEWATLAAYGVLVSVAVAHHEPWADEAQAWQLARCASLRELFGTHLHYEGSPGLWHLLLWILTRLHLSYAGLHWICGAVACGSAALLLFYSPFPRWIRLVLPFTFFLAFQLAVIARPYVLYPLVLFTLVASWRSAGRHPVRTALILGVMALLALHTAAISVGFALLYGIERWMEYREKGRLAAAIPRYLAGLVLLAALYGVVVLVARPAQDVWIGNMTRHQDKGKERDAASLGATDRRTGLVQVGPAELTLRTLSALGWGTIQPILLGAPFWILILIDFIRRHLMRVLLPVGCFLVFAAISYVNFWHAGLLAPTLIALYWMTWDAHPEGNAEGIMRPTSAALVYVAALHCCWTIFAVRYEYAHAYSPDKEAAAFLMPAVQRGARVAVTAFHENGIGAFKSVGLLPYFSRNIIVNEREPFWAWTTHNTVDADFLPALEQHPKFALLEYTEQYPYAPGMDANSRSAAALGRAGYIHTRTFCGAMPERFGFGEYSCHLLFVRASPDTAFVPATTQLP